MNSIMRLELPDAREDGIALLAAGERDDDPVLIVEGEYVLGVTSFWQGAFRDLADTSRQRSTGTRPARRETHLTVYGQDPKVVCLSRLAWTLWFSAIPTRPRGA